MAVRIKSITFDCRSPAFARTQLTEPGRPGRFAPAQIVAEHAPATDRLVAFPGRPVSTGR